MVLSKKIEKLYNLLKTNKLYKYVIINNLYM